ncbi:MAG: LysR family transcriptional regulator [Bryobacterales bacterium]|nr:LysR family transcriptional regulator [Bryobacterales bacterium]
MNPPIEFRQLRYVVAVAEELHFTRAAERLHLTQSALTRQIMQLEDVLGVRLFHRDTRNVRLTAAGEVFVEEAKRVLAFADRAVRLARGTQAGEFGEVRIAYSPFIDVRVVNELKAALAVVRPSLQLSFHGVPTAEQIGGLLDGTYQAGLVFLPIRDEAIEVEVLFGEQLHVALAAGHRLARKRQIELRVIHSEPLIWMPRRLNPAFHDHFQEWCRTAAYHPVIAQEVTSVQECLQFVSQGVGISFVSSSMRLNRFEGIAFRPLIEPSFVLETGIAYRRDNKAGVVGSILTVARQKLRRVLDDGHAPE